MDVTHSDCAAFMANIRDKPADDVPRLVYADWLDEHAGSAECPRLMTAVCPRLNGRPCPTCNGRGRVSNGFAELAEFIRLQCERATIARVRAALLDDEIDWSRCESVSATWCPNCGDCCCRDREFSLNDDDCPLHSVASKHDCLSQLIRRGEAAANRSTVLFNQVRPQFGYEIPHVWMDDAENAECFPLLIVRRGLPDEWRGPLAAFPEVPRLCRQFPLTLATLTDREPERDEGYFQWVSSSFGTDDWRWDVHRGCIPWEIFRLLDGYATERKENEHVTAGRYYRSVGDATAALSRACLACGRKDG